jgi:2-methylisocitrate lyase-like PEP mutase family enzyme
MTTFQRLHHGPALLILPNAWDAGSARLIESLGARAIATTSAGLAWSRGYPDGNALANDQLIAATRDIVRAIGVPLSVDIEEGYSSDEHAVARLAAAILNAGAAGINIEDGTGSPDQLCRKIAAIRDSSSRSGGDLFVNARTDVCLRGIAVGDAAVDEVIDRAARYRAAGADGLFVPGLIDGKAMAAIAAAIHPMPLNVMAAPGLPSVDALQSAGVRRLSAGSAIAQAIWGRTSRLATAFLEGDVSELFAGAAEYGKMNALFARNSGIGSAP